MTLNHRSSFASCWEKWPVIFSLDFCWVLIL